MTKCVLISINTSWNIVNFRGTLIRALRGQGYAVTSAAPRDAYTQRLTALVDAHIDLPMDNAGTSLFNDAALFFRYLRVLRAVRPAVMLTYTIKPNIYGTLAARALGIPVIANVSGLGTAFIRTNWLTAVVKQLYRIAFRGAACVFFQNAHDRNLFVGMKLVATEKAVLIAGSGIDLDYFHPSHAAPRDPAAPIAFVLIARLLWDKGIGEYVAAARIVKAAYPQVRFSLVGPRGIQNKTAIANDVIDQWMHEGLIDYLGETDTVREVIAAHDCVVLPSYREGLSRLLLEAAAMGKPLIATNVPGCAEVIDHKKNGLLCKVYDAQDLADAMMRFVNLSPDERARMGTESRTKAEREFGEQQVIDAYLTRIDAVLPS